MSVEVRAVEAGRHPDPGAFEEGERVGRFIFVRDRDGRGHAVAAQAVGAVCETDEGTMMLLAGGRMLHLERSMRTVLGWLDGRGPG